MSITVAIATDASEIVAKIEREKGNVGKSNPLDLFAANQEVGQTRSTKQKLGQKLYQPLKGLLTAYLDWRSAHLMVELMIVVF